jgi:transcriptional regulator of arginine metabolism
MKTRTRQEKIIELIRTKQIRTQTELADELKKQGVGVTQSCISRDIERLGIVKMNGCYALPRVPRVAAGTGKILDMDTAGDNLIVLKTEVGQAPPIAIRIDQAKIAAIVGTVAGDDTIFVAVKDQDDQREAIRRIIELFK